ncbi:hypothetical protein [Gordonia sp. NPDC003950]
MPRFQLSSSALTDVATTCTSTDGRWVGTVRLESIAEVDEVWLLYTKGGFIDRDWYRFVWHF